MARSRKSRNRQQNPIVLKKESIDGSPIDGVISYQSAMYRGPIPPPSILKQYDELLPGSAERLMNLFEKQANHRMAMEEIVIKGGSSRAYWGLACGFVISLLMLGLAGYLAAKGEAASAAIVASVDLAGLVYVFVYGTQSQRSEREQRAKHQRR